MEKHLKFLIILFLTLLASFPFQSQFWPEAQASDWKSPNGWPLENFGADLIPPRQWWAPSVLASFHFEKWVELDFPENTFKSVVGLTRKGELFQVVQYNPTKFVGRKLSGKRCVNEFALNEETGALTALTCDGKLISFSHNKWIQSPLPRLAKKASAWWIYSMVMAGLAAGRWGPDWLTQNLDLFAVAEAYFGLFSGAIISVVTYKLFDPLNQNPDGFVDLGKFREGKGHWLEQVEILSQNAPETLTDAVGLQRKQWEGPCLSLLIPRPEDEFFLNRRHY